MRNLDQIKKEIVNLYGGDTEEFNKLKPIIIRMMANGDHVPKIVSNLYHNFNTMSTPDSLGSYIKIYLKKEKERYNTGRKGKILLIDDDEYQLALNERARVTGSNYAYYSKSARVKKKLSNEQRQTVEKNFKGRGSTHTISTIGMSKNSINEAEKKKESLIQNYKKLSKEVDEYLFNGIKKYSRNEIKEKNKTIEQIIIEISKTNTKIEFLRSLESMAKALGTNMDQFTIIYNDLEDYDI